MKVLKKVAGNSFIMILAATAIFFALYGALLYASGLDTVDLKDSAIGEWSAVQYYLDGEKYVCSQGHPVNVTLTNETISIKSEDFPAVDQLPCSWKKRSVEFTLEDQEIVSTMFFDESDYLHMVIQVWKLELSLIRKSVE